MDAVQVLHHELAVTQGKLARAYMSIERVREIHFSYEPLDGYGNYMDAQCYECRKKYPCPTIKALDKETGG